MKTIRVNNSLEGFSIKLNVNEGCVTISIESYHGESKKVIVPPSIGGISVTAIGDFTFLGSENIKQVILPEGLVSIGTSAFGDCAALTGVKLPESLISIGYHAFENCEQLSNINLPKGLVDIKASTFADCSKLTEFTVDENNPVFTAVDGVLFDKAMTTLISFPAGKKGDYAIPDGVFYVEDRAFIGCNDITHIHIPQSVIGSFHFEGERLAGITVSEQNQRYSDIDGVLFNKEGTILLRYPQGRENNDYIVPDGVTIIGRCAFDDCKCLADIILPEGLQFIGKFVFLGCEQLTAVTLPMSLKYIREGAFDNCSNLQTITLSKKTSIGYKAFEGFSGKLVYRD